LLAHELVHVVQQTLALARVAPTSSAALEAAAVAIAFTTGADLASLAAPGAAAGYGIVQADPAGESELHFFGKAGESGVGVLYIRDWSSLTPQEQAQVRFWLSETDQSYGAGIAGPRQPVSAGQRRAGNQVARVGQRGLKLPSGTASGHTPDMAGGGEPMSPQIGLPAKVNSSIGGQWKRYEHGFRFTGISAYDEGTGNWIYLSPALEHEPPATTPGEPVRDVTGVIGAMPASGPSEQTPGTAPSSLPSAIPIPSSAASPSPPKAVTLDVPPVASPAPVPVPPSATSAKSPSEVMQPTSVPVASPTSTLPTTTLSAPPPAEVLAEGAAPIAKGAGPSGVEKTIGRGAGRPGAAAQAPPTVEKTIGRGAGRPGAAAQAPPSSPRGREGIALETVNPVQADPFESPSLAPRVRLGGGGGAQTTGAPLSSQEASSPSIGPSPAPQAALRTEPTPEAAARPAEMGGGLYDPREAPGGNRGGDAAIGQAVHEVNMAKLQARELDKAAAEMARLRPAVDRLTAQGYWVIEVAVFDKPKIPDLFGIAAGWTEEKDINRFIRAYLKYGKTPAEAKEGRGMPMPSEPQLSAADPAEPMRSLPAREADRVWWETDWEGFPPPTAAPGRPGSQW
jgi:hypothetical protein